MTPASLDDLVAQQRLLALRSLLRLLIPLLLLPVVLALIPSIAAFRVGPLPLGWLLLGPAVFPLFVVLGRRHERQADAIEQRWIEGQR